MFEAPLAQYMTWNSFHFSNLQTHQQQRKQHKTFITFYYILVHLVRILWHFMTCYCIFLTSPKKSSTPSHQVQPDFLTGLGTKVQVAALVTLSMDPRRLRLRVGTWAVAMTLVGSADRTCFSSILGLQHNTKHGLFQAKLGSFGFQVYEYYRIFNLCIF